LFLECYRVLTGEIFTGNRTDKFSEAILSKDQRQATIIEIEKIFNKPYQETFNENILIFERYMKFTYDNNIKSLVIVPPFSKIMSERIPNEMENETLRVIKELQAKYKFEYVDFMRDKDFNDEHFYNFSHLNNWGKKLLTEKIVLKYGF